MNPDPKMKLHVLVQENIKPFSSFKTIPQNKNNFFLQKLPTQKKTKIDP